MSTEPTGPRGDREPDPDRDPGSDHLAEDVEALEDPVHSGDAERQAHEQSPGLAGGGGEASEG